MFGQRNGHPLGVKFADGLVDGTVEIVSIDERLVREMVRLEVMPDGFDVAAAELLDRQV